MASYKLSIVTPEGQIFQDQIESMSAPGKEGSLGVLANHAPMLVALKPGLLKVRKDSADRNFQIQSGILEVDSTHNVVVLVDQAVPAQ